MVQSARTKHTTNRVKWISDGINTNLGQIVRKSQTNFLALKKSNKGDSIIIQELLESISTWHNLDRDQILRVIVEVQDLKSDSLS